jgi:hypothetical protein
MRENKPALIDPFGQRMEYVRLPVTDRGNLPLHLQPAEAKTLHVHDWRLGCL